MATHLDVEGLNRGRHVGTRAGRRGAPAAGHAASRPGPPPPRRAEDAAPQPEPPALALSARQGPRLLAAASETCGVACWLRGDLLWPVGCPGVQPSVIPAVPGRACPREIPLGSLDGVKNAALPGVGTGASPPPGGLKPSTEREAASSEGGPSAGLGAETPASPVSGLRPQAAGRLLPGLQLPGSE